MFKKQNFDYSTLVESEIIEQIEASMKQDSEFDFLTQTEYLEDKLRSQKVAKQYKKLLGLSDNSFNPIRRNL